MTLESNKVSRRDWFAGVGMLIAAARHIADDETDNGGPLTPNAKRAIAKEAFDLADAMIAASTDEEEEA